MPRDAGSMAFSLEKWGAPDEKWMTPGHHSQTGRGRSCGTPPSSAPETNLADTKIRFYEIFG